jgi:hypothetical protein
MMVASVDREDRDKAAALLRSWLDGTVTNFELDDQWPWHSADPGVVDIGKETWRYYDDFPEQTLSPHSLSDEQVAIIRRCLKFLDTNEPYLVLQAPAGSIPEGPPIRVLLSALARRKSPMELVVDERRKPWWPFSDAEQLHRSGMGQSGSTA